MTDGEAMFLPDYHWQKLEEENRWWAENHRPFISAYTPQWTVRHEQEGITNLRSHLKRWTVQWWLHRGYTVFFDDKEGTDRFGVTKLDQAEKEAKL